MPRASVSTRTDWRRTDSQRSAASSAWPPGTSSKRFRPRFRRSGKVRRDLRQELRLGIGADQLLHHLATLEQQQGRDALDAVAERNLAVLVDVDLHHLQTS